jgi:hypothetical protein
MRRLSLAVVLLIGLAGCSSSHGRLAARTVQSTTSAAANYGPDASQFVDLHWLDRRRGWALVGRPCAATRICAAVYATRDGGQTWIRLTARDAFCARSSTCVTGLRFVSARIGYLYGSASFLTRDGGRRWTRLPGRQTESVVASGGSVFRLVYQSSGCPGPCRPALERAAPGARRWTTIRRWPGAPGFGEQLLAGGRNLYVVFYGHIAGGEPSAHAVIAVSHDRGRSWFLRSDPCGGAGVHEDDMLAAAAAGDSLAVLCVRRSGPSAAFTALSRDAGRTFSAGARIPVGSPEQIAVRADGVIAVGNGGTSGGGSFGYELALSSDGGRSWRVTIRDREPLAEDLGAGSLAFVGPRSLSWVGSPYVVWLSSDAGATWRRSPAP